MGFPVLAAWVVMSGAPLALANSVPPGAQELGAWILVLLIIVKGINEVRVMVGWVTGKDNKDFVSRSEITAMRTEFQGQIGVATQRIQEVKEEDGRTMAGLHGDVADLRRDMGNDMRQLHERIDKMPDRILQMLQSAGLTRGGD